MTPNIDSVPTGTVPAGRLADSGRLGRTDSQRRILVVDDDAAIRRLLLTFLRRRGFDPLGACNGREALVEMRAGNADLVLLDLMMPEVSGWEVLVQRAAEPALSKIPVIVVTATNSGDARAGLLGKNVCAVLGKPFDLEFLLLTVLTNLPSPAPTSSDA